MVFAANVTISLEERGVLFEGGVPRSVLKPGIHKISPWGDGTVQKFSTAAPLGDVPAALVAVLASEVVVVDVGADERGVVFEREVPVRRLPPGRHLLWTEKGPRVEKFNVQSDLASWDKLSAALRAVLKDDVTVVDVGEEERVVLVVENVATRALPAGRHVFWNTKSHTAVRYDAKQVVAELPPAHLALFGADVDVVTVGRLQRGLVKKKKRPVRWLGAGTHHLWKHADVSVDVIDVSGVDAVPVDADVKAVVAAGEYIDVTVPEGAAGVRFKDGAVDDVLPPGRYAAFTVAHQVQIVAIDLRERVVTVQGQDILTRDKVTVRLNASITYRVADVKLLVTSAKSADEVLYLAVQLALRDQVARHTLDELLGDRTILDENVRPTLDARAKELGIALMSFGVKDIILPGEMRALLNKVIEAQKTAEANVIVRREETAAVRSMAQTAKLLEENPVLLRLKELDAYKELAEKVGTLTVVLGADGAPSFSLGSSPLSSSSKPPKAP
jgi:regulator of protease activity HflC (stomatin/prohibitin superfamily)